MYFKMFGFELYVDLFFNGLKASEVIYFLDRNKLHKNDINYGCVIVNVTKVLNWDLQLLHASKGVDMLSKENGSFIEWDTSQVVKHTKSFTKQAKVNEIIVVVTYTRDTNILHEIRFSFLLRKVILLHICLDRRDWIAIGLMENVNEKDSFEGLHLGFLSFGVLMKELVFPCPFSP